MNNRRVSKASGTNSTAYTYAEDIGEGSTALSATSLLGEYTATVTKEYIYLGDTPIAVVQAGNILTIQTDHLDTPRQLTDNTKKVVWNWAYSAFGENQPTNTNNTVFNLRYPGQYYDFESKLHYNINRYYDPATGRYNQSDPIGLAGGINTYTYVGGNTVRWSDAWGLDKKQVDTILEKVRNNNPDLNVPKNVYISTFFSGEDTAITNPLTLNITLSNYYNSFLDSNGLINLYKTLVHESIHRTKGFVDMILRPFDHPDIYAEAEKRAIYYAQTGGNDAYMCKK
jgi:RHS repeat-associated protein